MSMGWHECSQGSHLPLTTKLGEEQKKKRSGLPSDAAAALIKEQDRREEQACLRLYGLATFPVPPWGQASFSIFQVAVPVGCFHGELPDPDK